MTNGEQVVLAWLGLMFEYIVIYRGVLPSVEGLAPGPV